ncbi:MAG: IS30 family transposase [Myxococcota bacterium]
MRAGGIKPVPRKRAARHLSLEEREEISRRLVARESIRGIARALGRPASTVSREVNRNDGRFRYRAVHADRRAWQRGIRPKARKLDLDKTLRAHVVEKLGLYWSPQQIAGWLRETFAEPAMHVSHESIYRSLFVQARGSLKKELTTYLRRRRSVRRPGVTSKKRPLGGAIQDGISIRERPAEVEDRAVPGHWEGDLLCGKKGTQIVTLVERMTRFVILVKVDTAEPEHVADKLIEAIKTLPKGLEDSLTWDRGRETANHEKVAFETKMDIYFCDPRSP